MIQDHELSQLGSLQTGIVASIGFVALGGGVGLFGPFLTSVERITSASRAPLEPPLSGVDIWYVAGFPGSLILAAVCLIISSLAWLSNKGLKERIRKRPKHGLGAR